MKDSLRGLFKQSKGFMSRYKKYASFVFILAILVLYTFLVFQISRLSLAEPSDSDVDQQAQSIGRLKLDQESINKIQQLEDQNVNVQSIFKSARDNPFQD